MIYYDNGNKIEIVDSLINKNFCKLNESHKRKMKYDKYFYKSFCKKSNYTLLVNKDIFKDNFDAVLVFDAPCDMAHMYCNGKIVADYININNTWEIGLLRFKNEILNGSIFEIRTSAIKKAIYIFYC